MQPKLVEKQAFKVVGMRGTFTLQKNCIGDLWAQFNPRIAEIKTIVNPNVSFGICECTGEGEANEESEFNYVAGVETDSAEDVPEGMITKTVPAAKYAVFTHKGSVDKMGETYNYIYGTWFPQSGYKRAEACDLEVYSERFTGPYDEGSEIDICVPICG
ncbi:MAG: GyrI-like domain-containing protein [Firmicutes bacterium]|nr:GyrI-like domain-containing protein [Bacillota bacterium]